MGWWCEKVQGEEGRDGSFKIVALIKTKPATDLSTKLRDHSWIKVIWIISYSCAFENMCSSMPDKFLVLVHLVEILAFAAVVQRFLHGFVLRSNPGATRSADKLYHSISEDFVQVLSFLCSVCVHVLFFNYLGLMWLLLGYFLLIWLHFLDSLPCLGYVTFVLGFET